MSGNRDKNGRFLPGNKGGGRPKEDPEVKEILKAACPEAARRLVEYMSDKNAKIAMWAITEVLDRTQGKPMQASKVDMDITGFLDVREQIRSVLVERAALNDAR